MRFGSSDDYEDFKEEVQSLASKLAMEILYHYKTVDKIDPMKTLTALGDVWAKIAIEGGLSDREIAMALISIDNRIRRLRENV